MGRNTKKSRRKRNKSKGRSGDNQVGFPISYFAIVGHIPTERFHEIVGQSMARMTPGLLTSYEIPFDGAIDNLKKKVPIMIYVAALMSEDDEVCHFLTSLAATPQLADIPYIVIFADAKGTFLGKSFGQSSIRSTGSKLFPVSAGRF